MVVNEDGTKGAEHVTDTGTELEPPETLEAAIGALEVVLNKHVDARLATIEAHLVTCVTFIAKLEELTAAMMENPMFQMMVENGGDGGSFGFPGFGGK